MRIMAQKKISLKCSLCLNLLTEPKLLPCFHTFCLKCLQDYARHNAKDKAFKCPVCEESITIPARGIKAFDTNYFIQPDVVITRNCDVCNERAIFFCSPCEEYYCDLCTNAHRRMKLTRNHKLTKVKYDSARPEVKFKKKTFCSTHVKEEVKIVCLECNEQICVICKIAKHSKHKATDVKSLADQRRDDLAGLVSKLNDNRNNMAKLDKVLEDLARQYPNEIDKQSTELTKTAQQVIGEIKEREKALQKELDERTEESLNNIRAKRKDIQNRRAAAETMVISLQRAVEKSSDADIVESFKDVETEVKSVSPDRKITVFVWDGGTAVDGEFLGSIKGREVTADGVGNLVPEKEVCHFCYKLSTFTEALLG